MKCKIFVGTWFEAEHAFNNWAKGKQLTREVIIHEIVIPPASPALMQLFAIIVYHPEGKEWDATDIPITTRELEHTQIQESAIRETY